MPLSFGGLDPTDPQVSIPGELLIDRIVPWLPIGAALLFFGLLIAYAIREINVVAEQYHADNDKRLAAYWILGKAFAATFAIFVLAPGLLCLAGVFASSLLLGFKNQRMLIWKCLAVGAMPLAINVTFNQFDLHSDWTPVSLWICVPLAIGLLWLLLRQKWIPFG